MNANHIYEIYEITAERNLSDLTIGLAMFRHENPGVIDHDEDVAIREFIGGHTQDLSKAFAKRDREYFAKVVAECEAEDKK